MTFIEAVKSAYRNYVKFSGRSSRSEYWWYALFYGVIAIVIYLVEGGTTTTTTTVDGMSAAYAAGPVGSIWVLANLLPSIAIGVRRLHDKDRSGWWLLIALVPLVGALVLLYWFVTRGTEGANRFGPDPLGPTGSVFA